MLQRTRSPFRDRATSIISATLNTMTVIELTADLPPATGWRLALASMQHRQFRWMLASDTPFFFAMNGQFLVRSYLAFKLTDNAFALGLVNLAVALPMLIISPFGGVLADRVEKKKLIIGGQFILIVNEVAIFALLLTGSLAFWHLCAAAFVMGCVFPFIMPARQSIVAFGLTLFVR